MNDATIKYRTNNDIDITISEIDKINSLLEKLEKELKNEKNEVILYKK